MNKLREFVDRLCAAPRCPNCNERDTRVVGEKAICRRCSNVWNWRKPALMGRT